MNAFFASIRDGLRALVLMRPRGNLGVPGAGVFLALVVLYLGTSLLLAATDVTPPWAFQGNGVLVVLADALFTLATAWVLVRAARRPAVIWAVASIILAATIGMAIVLSTPLGSISTHLIQRGDLWAALVIESIRWLWWLLILVVLAARLAPGHVWRAIAIGAGAFVISSGLWWWLPDSPMLVTSEAATAATTADGNTVIDDDSDDAAAGPSAEQVLFNQSHLLGDALAKLRPRDPGRINLYVIAFAGDGSEDVFRNEAEYAEKLFSQRFDAAGHVLVLENNPATVSTRPLATLTNLTTALDAIATRMNPAEDILLLFITTHGSADHHLLVDLDPLPLDQIDPESLNEALRTNPVIRWKVIIVSACYSGGFIDALRDDSTLVITSARSDRTSFGCGVDSDITYFGKAYFAEALNQTTSFTDAFARARKTISQWEVSDKVEEPSDPQMASNSRIEAKLALWQAQLHAGAPVPFVPAAQPADADADTSNDQP